MQRYIVTDDIERTAPEWVAVLLDCKRIRLIHHIVDGAVKLKGVKLDDELARVGDTIIRDKCLRIERR